PPYRPREYRCMRLVDSLRIETRCLLELYLIPGLCVLLPWSIGFRWLRFCARWPRLFSQEWRAALAEAQRWVVIDDPARWAQQYRACRLVDHADYWLSRTRSRGWLDRHVTVRGEWPRTRQ